MSKIKHVENNLWRSAIPKDLTDVIEKDFKVLISLETGLYTLVTDTKREHQFPVDYGLDHYDMDCSFITAPAKWQVEKFLEVVSNDHKTLVHCLSGVDRTGFMCAVYRMKVCGWSFNDARDEWKREGRHWWYFYWERELRKWS
jgi:protein-tyrosine phosphatase